MKEEKELTHESKEEQNGKRATLEESGEEMEGDESDSEEDNEKMNKLRGNFYKELESVPFF
jgi:hypothetical protein